MSDFPWLTLMLRRPSGAHESFTVPILTDRVYELAALLPGGAMESIEAASVPCAFHTTHAPVPVITQLHHVFPLELQKRIWPDVERSKPETVHDKTLVPICGTGHNNTHYVIDALLRGKPVAEDITDPQTMALAREAIARYNANQPGIGKPRSSGGPLNDQGIPM